MYDLLYALLSDKKGGEIFVLFGPWHFLFIAFTVVMMALILFLQRGKSVKAKAKMADLFLNLAFGLYVADFFLMPLAQGEINIEKLPFHVCTTMCVMCFLSSRVPFLKKYRLSFVLLGFISNTVYLIYPAGVMWFAIHPLSYRVVQTLLFHSFMSIFGFVTLVNEYKNIELRKCHRDLLVVGAMVVWALVGNYAYNGEREGYSHFFNWFFVVKDPFGMFPEAIAPILMPFLNLAMFCAAEMLIHLAIWAVKRIKLNDASKGAAV